MNRFALRDLMERLDLRQPAFARRLGISQGQLSKVLSGKHSLGPRAVERARAIATAEAPDIISNLQLLEEVISAHHRSIEFRHLLASAVILMRKNK